MAESRHAQLRANVRDEERRRREEAVALSLQQQLDELRQLTREQAARQGRQEETLRQLEGQLAQARVELSEGRQETNRQLQVRHLEEQRLRQQLTDLQQRSEEPLRPLRTVQAQMAEIVDQVRQQREQTGHELRQIDDLRLQVDLLRAEVARAVELARQLGEIRETVAAAQAAHGRDLQRALDHGRLIEQEVRRRQAEVEQRIGGLGERIDEVARFRPGLEEAIRRTNEAVAVLPPQIEALRQVDEGLAARQLRGQEQAEERDGLLRERIEELRGGLAGEIAAVSAAVTELSTGLHRDIAGWEQSQRELANRLGALVVRVTGLQQADEQLLLMMRRAEERLVRSRLEQAQQAWEDLMRLREREQQQLQAGGRATASPARGPRAGREAGDGEESED